MHLLPREWIIKTLKIPSNHFSRGDLYVRKAFERWLTYD